MILSILLTAALGQYQYCGPAQGVCRIPKAIATSGAGDDFTCSATSGNKCLAVTNDGARIYTGASAYMSASGTVTTFNTQVTATAFNASAPTTNGYQLGSTVILYSNTGAPGSSTVLNGRATTSATAEGVAFTNNTTLSTAGSQIAAFYAGNLTGKVLGVGFDGSLVGPGTALVSLQAPSTVARTIDSTRGRLVQADGTRWRELGEGRGWGLEGHSWVMNTGEGTLPAVCAGAAYQSAPVLNGVAQTVTVIGTAPACQAPYIGDGTTNHDTGWLETANAGDTAGEIDTTAWVKTRGGPVISQVVGFGVDALTNVRSWALVVGSANPTGSDTLPANSAGFRYSSAATDTVWQLCTTDATPTQTCTSTTVTVATSTNYFLRLAFAPGGGTLYGTVNGVTIAKTTNLPTATTALKVSSSIEALTASNRSISKSGWEVFKPN